MKKKEKELRMKLIGTGKKKPIKNSKELASIIIEAKKKYNNYKKNPATKTFQAIRIFVNQELTELVLALKAATKLLSEGGILLVVTFHSLEDKIVKNFFRKKSGLKPNPHRHSVNIYSEAEKHRPSFKIITKKVLIASNEELSFNYRARSAKLRCAEKLNNLDYAA